MFEEFIQYINNTPFGEKIEPIVINGQDYEIKCQWKKRIKVTISSKKSIIDYPDNFEIRKLPLASIIFRYPQYSLSGNKTALSEKLLSNQYTRALLYFPSSKIICHNKQISYCAQLKKKNSDQLEIIIKYFRALLVNI